MSIDTFVSGKHFWLGFGVRWGYRGNVFYAGRESLSALSRTCETGVRVGVDQRSCRFKLQDQNESESLSALIRTGAKVRVYPHVLQPGVHGALEPIRVRLNMQSPGEGGYPLLR